MTEAGWTRNKPTVAGWYWWRQEKGMMEVPREVVYSPFYRGLVTQGERLIAGDGEWLGPITPTDRQQGRVAALDEVERYMAMRLRLAEASLATEILAGNKVKQGRERAAIAELHGMQRHVSDIKEYNAQQAQGGVGDDLFILP